MFWRILKKDLKRKKAMNTTLSVFVILCSLFLGGSLSNLNLTTNALNKFAEMSGTADYYFDTMDDNGISDWLSRSKNIISYEEAKFLSVPKNKMTLNGKALVDGNSEPRFSIPSKEYSFAFDENDNKILSVQDGECCISNILARKNGAKIGDTLDIIIGDIRKTLTIVHITKDYVFGSDYFFINRVLIGEKDFNDFSAEEEVMASSVWSVSTDDYNQFIKEKNQQAFVITYEYSGEKIDMAYHMEKIVSAIMMIVSLVLIVISFTLLRFTIHTTIEDDYREIGVMKAIGINNMGVRSLFIAKYLVISVTGALLGVIFSIPFTDILTEGMRRNIVIQNMSGGYFINFISAMVIIAVTMLFCLLATGKVKKMTAVQAIREGSSGERFKRKGLLHLKGKTHGNIPFFMAVNDVFSSLSSYIIIFIALAAVMQLIILPYNALSILKNGKNMMPYFVQESADFYADLSKEASDIIVKDHNYDALVCYVQSLEDRCRAHGLDLETNLSLSFAAQVYKTDKDGLMSIPAWKQTKSKPIDISYHRGTPPLLANEIAVSVVSMEKLNVTLGDKVHIVFGEDDREYIITGSFESMSNAGESIIFSPHIYPNLIYCSPIGYLQFTFINSNDAGIYAEKLTETLPGINLYTADEKVYAIVEDVIDTLGQIIFMTVMLGLIITSLVVFLIGNTLLSKDKGSISLLKSIGFSNGSLRLWQTTRIAITTFSAALFGVALSFVLNPFVIRQTFGMLGATHVPPSINAANVFGLFPGLFIMTAVFVAWVVSRRVRKIDMRNVAHLE